MLQSMLTENREAISAAETALEECRREKDREDARLEYLSTQYQNIKDWAEVFASACVDEKKMILSRIIERIEVDRDYHLTIRFFVSMEDFLIERTGENVTVCEAGSSINRKIREKVL